MYGNGILIPGPALLPPGLNQWILINIGTELIPFLAVRTAAQIGDYFRFEVKLQTIFLNIVFHSQQSTSEIKIFPALP